MIDSSPVFKQKILEVKKKHTDFFLHIYVYTGVYCLGF